jgi:L-fuculose-phosphate aldolase
MCEEMQQLEQLREEIIKVGKAAHQRGLIVARGGNLSARVSAGEFLVTAHLAALGFLTAKDLLHVDLEGKIVQGEGKLSTETKLHTAVYQHTEANAVVHLHPPYTNVLAVRGVEITPITFESALFLGSTTPIVPQNTPSVTNLDAVVEALRLSSIIILKEHGTVAVGDDLWDAFFLTELLEEAAMMTFIGKNLGTSPDSEKTLSPAKEEEVVRHPVFSKEHIERTVALVNQDEEAQRLGKSTHLTVNYAIKLLETDQIYNFHFQEGKIVEVTHDDEDANFLLTGRRQQWIAVFNGLVDPFAATTQKKLRLQKGHIGDLSKWYPPFYRIFKLWRHAPVQ